MRALLVSTIAVSHLAMGCGDADEDELVYGADPFSMPDMPGTPPAFDPEMLEELGYLDEDEIEPTAELVEQLRYAEQLGYAEQQGYPQQQGGYGEPGAFRGESEVGGIPTVSGTIDNSGEGNHVFSVGGKVLELP